METSSVRCASLQVSLESYSQTFWIYFTVRGVNECLIQFNHTGAAVGTHCACSCWGCSTEKQGEVLREDSGLIGDTSILWCELKKIQQKQCYNPNYYLFILPELLIAGLWAFSAGRLFHCSPWHCCTLGAAIKSLILTQVSKSSPFPAAMVLWQVFVQCDIRASLLPCGPRCQASCKSLLIWCNCESYRGMSSWEPPSGHACGSLQAWCLFCPFIWQSRCFHLAARRS